MRGQEIYHKEDCKVVKGMAMCFDNLQIINEMDVIYERSTRWTRVADRSLVLHMDWMKYM